jgi:uncharacterized membrane protein
MRTRLLALWDALRTSYWFLPSLMAVAALALAWTTVQVDERWSAATDRVGIFAATPSGARSMLSGVAAAMITIAGLTFSITIVAITVASQQYGSRVLRNFMRDMTNQFALGTFIAVFLYCLIVLGAIRSEEQHTFVPDLSVTLGVALAVGGLGMLIYYIHHLSMSLDAARLIEMLGRDVDSSLDALFPEQLGIEEPSAPVAVPHGDGIRVAAASSGYVQAVDEDSLLELASRRDLVIRLERRPGDRVVEGHPIATVWGAVDAALVRDINEVLVLGSQRTPLQDLEFTIEQLVDIAVRALSPGINDPFTAILCVDRLTICLVRLARRRIPRPERFDTTGALRVIARSWTFAGALDAAFDQIRQHGDTSTAVTARLLESLAIIAASTRRRADAAAVLRQSTVIERDYGTRRHDAVDRQDVHERAARVREAVHA